MNSLTRREFGLQAGALLASAGLLRGAQPAQRERLPVAAIVTEYRRNSHASATLRYSF